MDELDKMLSDLEKMGTSQGIKPGEHPQVAEDGYVDPTDSLRARRAGGYAAPSADYVSPTSGYATPSAYSVSNRRQGGVTSMSRGSDGYAQPKYMEGRAEDNVYETVDYARVGSVKQDRPPALPRRPSGMSQQEADQTNLGALPPGSCAYCRQKIRGPSVSALGLTFHPEHFQCMNCEKSLSGGSFYEHKKMPFCEGCFQDLYAPKCGGCGKVIQTDSLRALDKSWHRECLNCAKCKKNLANAGFFERDGQLLCEPCYSGAQTTQCAACNKPILAEVIRALDKCFHPDCFVCDVCKAPFPGNNFYPHNGKPLCLEHFHALRGTVCSTCNKPIEGACVSALSKRFHPQCFQCTACDTQLDVKKWKKKNNKPFCPKCYIKLFG